MSTTLAIIKKKAPNRARRWCITLNNYTPAEVTNFEYVLREIQNKVTSVKYLIWQFETGKEGTPHIQGYIEFINPRNRRGVKRYLGTRRVHLEVALGNSAENIEYCSKDSDRTSDTYTRVAGVASASRGYRADIDQYETVRQLLDTQSLSYVARHHFQMWCRHHSALQSYLALRLQTRRRSDRTRLEVYLGQPGTGKTVSLEQLYPESAYWKEPNHVWWDGYIPEQHSVVIIDEFVGQIPLTSLNRLLGSSPTSVKIHGGMIPFLATTLILVSNLPADQWWKNIRIPLDALFRRIDEVHVHYSITDIQITKNPLEERARVSLAIKTASTDPF